MSAQPPFASRTGHSDAVTAAAGACGGVAVYILAAKLAHPMARFPAPLFPLLRAGIEEYSGATAAGLFALGAMLGAFKPKQPVLTGLATVALLPIAAILEMAVDPTSHNLWPIEFAFYGVESLPAVAGALLASAIRRTLSRGHNTELWKTHT